MKKFRHIAMTASAAFALFMVTMISNFGCFGPIYSPDLPKNAEKLRKF